MSFRVRLFIIITFAILVVLGISIFLLILQKQKKAATTPPTGSTAPVNQSLTSAGETGSTQVATPVRTPPPATLTPALTSLEAEQDGVKKLTKVFIERYYTYSSDNQFQNIKELQTLVTPSLWNKLSASMTGPAPTSFVGVTTVVFSSTITSVSISAIDVELKTRKVMNKQGKVEKSYSSYLVKAIKNNGAWLINSVEAVK